MNICIVYLNPIIPSINLKLKASLNLMSNIFIAMANKMSKDFNIIVSIFENAFFLI